MDDQFLIVFALRREAPPLRLVRDALKNAGYPAGIGVEIAGEATDAQLDTHDWEAALVRWHEPELHDVWLIERSVPGQDEAADLVIGRELERLAELPVSAGRLVAADHLGKTQAVYTCDILPALLEEDDHPAWAALDVALRCLAASSDGLVYGEADGYYDADGEMLLDTNETA
jgi:hypothetical protein